MAVTDTPTGERIGDAGSRFFVNSAQSMSRNTVDDIFSDDCEWDGSVDMELVRREVGHGYLVGKVQIRREIERLLRERGYGDAGNNLKRTANYIIQDVRVKRWRGKILCVKEDELSKFIADREHRIEEQRRTEAEHARKYRKGTLPT